MYSLRYELANLNYFFPADQPLSVRFLAGKVGMSSPISATLLAKVSRDQYVRLMNAMVTFNTQDSDKDYDTAVFVYVRSSDAKEILAQSVNNSSGWGPTAYDQFSTHSLGLQFDPPIRKADCLDPQITIGAQANGDDIWTFYATVSLTFIDGQVLSWTSPNMLRLVSEASTYVETNLDAPPIPHNSWPSSQPNPFILTLYHPSQEEVDGGFIQAYQDNGRYYHAALPWTIDDRVKITGVRNNSVKDPVDNLWFSGPDGTVGSFDSSSPVALDPGQSTDVFNGHTIGNLSRFEAYGPQYYVDAQEEQDHPRHIDLLVSWVQQ